MLTNERKEAIYEYINKHNSAYVETLSKLFKVSKVTIRRDLSDLDEKGLIQRVHGGAKKISVLIREKEFINRLNTNTWAKSKIAKAAVGYIRENMVIFLDAGTTTYKIAEEIINSEFKNLTIFTNDINIAHLLYQSENNNIIVVCGNVKNGIGNIQGAMTNNFLKSIHLELSFIGTSSVDLDLQLHTPDQEKINLKKNLLANSNKPVLVVDSSKIGEESIYAITKMSDFSMVITDYKFSNNQKRLLNNKTTIVSVDMNNDY